MHIESVQYEHKVKAKRLILQEITISYVYFKIKANFYQIEEKLKGTKYQVEL